MSYDQRCHDLALLFLRGYCREHQRILDDVRETKYARDLAQAIQRTIEDYLEAEVKP